MWQFDNCTVPMIQTELPGPRAREPARTRPALRVAVVHARLSAGRGTRQRGRHRGRGRQSVPRFHRRHRGHVDGPLPSASRRRHSGPGRQADAHVRDRFLLRAADRPGAAAGRDLAPGTSPKRVFFTNSGAEALEAALKLARWHTGRSRAIAFFGAFHGRTYGAMSLSGSKLVHRRGFSPLVPDIHHVAVSARPGGCDKPRTSAARCVAQIEETIFAAHRTAG